MTTAAESKRRYAWDERRTGTVVTNNSVREVGVEAHARRERNWQICKQAHAEGCQGRNGSGRGNQILLDFLDAQHVFGVAVTQIRGPWRANAGTTSIRYDHSLADISGASSTAEQ
jgi:hypothetical protein